MKTRSQMVCLWLAASFLQFGAGGALAQGYFGRLGTGLSH